MDPKDRIAVVTGAAGGIGSALVRALIGAGARLVVATDIAAPTSTDSKVLPRALDVTDQAATSALVEEIESGHGPVDLWFANAGVSGGGQYDAPDSMWEQQWQVNVMAHVYANVGADAGMACPRRGPSRHDGVDGGHPHIAGRHGVFVHEARRCGLRGAHRDHVRGSRHQGLMRLPRRGRHAHAARRTGQRGQRGGQRQRVHRRRRGALRGRRGGACARGRPRGPVPDPHAS